jgi:hypothetical protein
MAAVSIGESFTAALVLWVAGIALCALLVYAAAGMVWSLAGRLRRR